MITVVASHRRGVFPEPVAAKVPEIAFLFWVIKILTTAGGEATSDYLALGSRLEAGAIEAGIFVACLVWQFRTRRYTAAAYWAFAYAIAIFGTGVADAMHLVVGIPYAGTTVLWAIVLALIFWLWYRSEHTLSIHSIYTRQREVYYWAVVFATFALGTALGDLTATTLHLGYLASGIMFFFVILIPAVAWKFVGLNSVVAFWFAYVVNPSARRLVRRLLQQAALHQRRQLRGRPGGPDHHDHRGRPGRLPGRGTPRHPAAR